jgi:hypothetical protein
MVRMPNTIGDNLQRLITAKTDIKNAIITKGGTCPSSHGLEDFATDIGTIPGMVTSYPATWDDFEEWTYPDQVKFFTVTNNSIIINNSNLYIPSGGTNPCQSAVYAYIPSLFGMTGNFLIDEKLYNVCNQSTNPPSLAVDFDLYISDNGYLFTGTRNDGGVSIYIRIFNYIILDMKLSGYYKTEYMNATDRHVSMTVNMSALQYYPGFFYASLSVDNNRHSGSIRNVDIRITNIQVSLNL